MANIKRPPLSKGETLQLNIENLSHDGEGVARLNGFAVFVPGALPGETVTAEVISVQKSYARALLQSLTSTSAERENPPCEHYEQCGGCQLQHLSYQAQLSLKQKTVEEALQRIGGIRVPVHPTIGMKEPWRYRNKAQVPVGQENNHIVAGFYEKRSHSIVDLKCCHIQHPANDNIVHTVRTVLRQNNISAYNEKNHTGLVRHIMARTSFTTNEVLVVIVTNGLNLPHKDTLINALQQAIPNLCGIVQNINTRPGNTILGKQDITLYGRPWLSEQLAGLKYRVSPRSFFQVNPVQTEILYAKTLAYAALTGRETVFDLYCGIGTISLSLARSAARVIGVESVEDAVRDARENAAINNITNTEFHTGTAENIVPQLYRQGYTADVVVVDPPRKGCDPALLSTITKMSPSRIVYVSCNPATLARDLKYLHQHKYIPQEVQPVDMFPHTSHVEVIVKLEKAK